ncbi:hypothetical protein TorRG33x02_312850 [Trema orientale]|uniref:Uncharacterized protein n=1 Tax=Trema orientale TaxID=63057 RepID=A0A2P5BPZ2_TREOI|nr:hypothetical protein TorRG33x02_312850 [Trema orientale]
MVVHWRGATLGMVVGGGGRRLYVHNYVEDSEERRERNDELNLSRVGVGWDFSTALEVREEERKRQAH